jgi:ATP-dependent Lon protease
MNFLRIIFILKNAQKILDRDHFGLEDVKKRIIEHLAVLKLRNDLKVPHFVSCLAPQGVGKTSLGKSIAEALGQFLCENLIWGECVTRPK